MDNFIELFQRADTAEVMLPDGRLVKVEMDPDGQLLVTIENPWGPKSNPVGVRVNDKLASVSLPDGQHHRCTSNGSSIFVCDNIPAELLRECPPIEQWIAERGEQ